MILMEAIELCNIKQQDEAAQLIMKGRRSKRGRLSMASSPGTTTRSDHTTTNSGGGTINYDVATTTTTSTDHDQQSTEEEEDMANCLILLAQGHTRKPTINSDNNNNKVYVYQCKTCERCFPSFQALGGHRASHKKPKPTITNTHQLPPNTTPSHMQGLSFGKELEGDHTTSTTLSLHLHSSSSKCKVHECSICGAEFSSGQALGGHMRRHRSTFLPNSHQFLQEPKIKSTSNVFKLDLNLPAPDEDHTHTHSNFSSFPTSTENLLLFSPSSLLHCHY